MFIKEMDDQTKTANLSMKISQSARSRWDFLFPIAVPTSSGYSSDTTSEFHSEKTSNSLETAIDQAIQAAQLVIESWSKDRFVVLTARFSPQMKEYWTPERQECVCRSLVGISQPLSRIEILEKRPASPDSRYVVVRYITTTADSKVHVTVRLVIGMYGEIAAFYVSL
jgi:hypothetical protein